MAHQDPIAKRIERLLASSCGAPVDAAAVREFADEHSGVKAALAACRELNARLEDKLEDLQANLREIQRLAKEAYLGKGEAMAVLVNQVEGGRAGVTYRDAYNELKRASDVIAGHFPEIEETERCESAFEFHPPRTVPRAGEVMNFHRALRYTEAS